MPKWLRKALPLAIGVLVLIYLFTVDNPSSQLFEAEDDGVQQTAPAFFITDFESKQYDENGNLSQILRGSRADHYQPKGRPSPRDYTLIQQLEGEIFQSKGEPWLIRADQGRANGKGKKIILTGHVRLWIDNPERGRTELSTTKLVYFPKQQLATTDAAVTITHPDGKTTAVGLTAELDKQLLTLKHKVRSVHEPF